MDAQAHLIRVGRAEAEQLTQYLHTLPVEAWRQPSACAGWTVEDTELAMHGWDMRSRFDSAAHLSAESLGVFIRLIPGFVSPRMDEVDVDRCNSILRS